MVNCDISIIMPTFNSEKTIAESIDSISNQKTRLNFELVIVDDGSTDLTPDIIKDKMQRTNNIQFYKQDHNFQAAARNMGLKKASGKYIMFADDDDLYKQGFIELMGNAIQNKKLVISGIEKKFKNRIAYERISVLEKSKNNVKLIGNYLTKNKEMDVGLWNKIFEKKVIDDNNIQMTNENFFEDSLFVLQYLLAINYNEIGYIHKAMYVLKKHTGSTTNSFDLELKNKCINYISKVKSLLTNKKNEQKYLPAFAARIFLFYVHRNILNNKNWNSKDQRLILKSSMHYSVFKYLSIKYNLAIISAYFFPSFYINKYSKRYKQR